jgi:hypothetical protein
MLLPERKMAATVKYVDRGRGKSPSKGGQINLIYFIPIDFVSAFLSVAASISIAGAPWCRHRQSRPQFRRRLAVYFTDLPFFLLPCRPLLLFSLRD